MIEPAFELWHLCAAVVYRGLSEQRILNVIACFISLLLHNTG